MVVMKRGIFLNAIKMVICPLQSAGKFDANQWIVAKPYVTQKFGENRDMYVKYGLRAHNGVDLRAAEGAQIYAPFEGVVKIKDSGKLGYGLHIKLRRGNLELVLAHLSKVLVKDGDTVHLGDPIGLSGSTGFSTAPHLHVGMRHLDERGMVVDYGNGYLGYFDPQPYIITWLGTL